MDVTNTELENFIIDKPWAREMKEKLEKITNQGILKYFQIISQIGESNLELENWNIIFLNHVNDNYRCLLVNAEAIKQKFLDKIEKLVQKQTFLCKTLNLIENTPNFINMTYYDVINYLENNIKEYESVYERRLKEIDDLLLLETDFCKILGKKEKLIFKEALLSNVEEIGKFHQYIDELKNEKSKRKDYFLEIQLKIIEIVNKIKYKPNVDFERQLITLPDTSIMLDDVNIGKLDLFYENLLGEQAKMLETIRNLQEIITNLWQELEIPISQTNDFLKNCDSESYETINKLNEEIQRLEKIKQDNIWVFINKLRKNLEIYWAKCLVTDEEKAKFKYFNTDIYNKDVLSIFDYEVLKWSQFYSKYEMVFLSLEEYTKLWEQIKKLEFKEQDPKRYQNRGGQLLREEKERNKIKIRLIKIEENLKNFGKNYYTEYKKKFLIHNLTIEQYIHKYYENWDKEKKLRLKLKKQERELDKITKTTPVKNHFNLYPPGLNSSKQFSQSAPAKRKPLTPLCNNTNSNVKKIESETKFKTKLDELKRKRVKPKTQLSFILSQNTENINNTSILDYKDFESEISERESCRSSIIINSLAKPPLYKTDNNNR